MLGQCDVCWTHALTLVGRGEESHQLETSFTILTHMTFEKQIYFTPQSHLIVKNQGIGS